MPDNFETFTKQLIECFGIEKEYCRYSNMDKTVELKHIENNHILMFEEKDKMIGGRNTYSRCITLSVYYLFSKDFKNYFPNGYQKFQNYLRLKKLSQSQFTV